MPNYQFSCKKCGEFDLIIPLENRDEPQRCVWCGGAVKRIFVMPNITGTRDGFGIKNSFFDKKTNKVIDNWKSWEKAGFKQAQDIFPKDTMKQGIERKIEKIKKYDTHKKFHVRTGA